jgi:flavin-dependent dehydrogenase
MMSRPFQIVGGGLAGLALAIGLRSRGCPVIVHEAGNYPRHRVCGEFIAGLDPVAIREMGIESILNEAIMNQTTVWFCGKKPVLEARLPQSAPSLSRHKMDAGLAALFRKQGGDLHTGKRVSLSPLIDKKGEGWIFTCGRKPQTDSPLIGLKCHLHNFPMSADLEMHLGKGGYVGITKVENNTRNLCGLFRRQPSKGLKDSELILQYLREHQLQSLADKLTCATTVEGSFCAVAALQYSRSTIRDDNTLCLGDAAAMIPPFTGHGMALALQSAHIALDPLLAYASGKSTWENTCNFIHRQTRLKFSKRRRRARFLNAILLHPSGPTILRILAGSHLLPFDFMVRRLHG